MMRGTESRHETAFPLPHRYPEGFILQLDAREVPAMQDNLGHCETVYKAAALRFFAEHSGESSEQRWPITHTAPEKLSGNAVMRWRAL
jgi:hypothetical protein